jgi:hypothetical protein
VGLAHIARDVGSFTLRVPNADLFGAPRAAPGRDAFAGWGIRLLRAASYRCVAQPENETRFSLSGSLVDLADLKPTLTALRHARTLAIHLAGELGSGTEPTRPAPRTLRDSDYTLRNSIGTRRHGDHFGDDASSQARSQPFWKQFSIALARSSCAREEPRQGRRLGCHRRCRTNIAQGLSEPAAEPLRGYGQVRGSGV